MIRILDNGDIEISNVFPVEQFGEIQYYTTTVSVEEIGEVFERLTYDPEAQRGEINGSPVIDHKHVSQMYESFIDGNSIRGHLTWNLRGVKGKEKFEYDSLLNRLVVRKDQVITLPDSAHRHYMLKKVCDELDDDTLLKSSFSLDVHALSNTDEKELFYTINGKVKAPNRNRILYLSDEIESRLLKDVIAQSELDGRIECVRENASRDNKLTKFSTLYDSLFGSEGVIKKGSLSEENYDEYATRLVDFYNQLLDTREEFSIVSKDDKKASKVKSMVLEEITWWGYAYLFDVLQEEKQWKRILRSKMNKKITLEGGESMDFFAKVLPMWQHSVIRPRYNPYTNKPELGTSVTNSNVTRRSIKNMFGIYLFQ